MSDDLNKNVINLFSEHNNNHITPEIREKIKYYAGFNYVKVKKDANGNKFNKSSFVDNVSLLVAVKISSN